MGGQIDPYTQCEERIVPVAIEHKINSENEAEKETEYKVNVVGEHLAVLSEVCENLCGQRFPHELGMTVLFRHGGLCASTAVAFLGERRMWDWIQNYHMFLSQLNQDNDIGEASRAMDLAQACVCGANPHLNAKRHCDALTNYGRVTMTKQIACHQYPRVSNVGSRWVTEGPWKMENLMRHQWRSYCAMMDLWVGVWFNKSEKLIGISNTILVLYEMKRKIRFRKGLLEREFLYSANREQIREAIANANGTKPVRIDGNDYTSRAEWVRVFYNGLRAKPLKAWPHMDL